MYVLTKTGKKIFALSLVLALLTGLMAGVGIPAAIGAPAPGTTSITEIKIDALDAPLGIDNAKPVFTWGMSSNIMGQKQTAYQIVVKSGATVVWDTDKVKSGISNGVTYAGAALTPETDYSCALTVWDAFGRSFSKETVFSTGMMDPNLTAWNGAQWIGSNELTLDAASACLFNINTDFQIRAGNTASLIFGADDFRLKDKFQNVFGAGGENYIRFELDLSGVTSDANNTGGVFNIYRVGYTKDDPADAGSVPYKSAKLAESTNAAVAALFTPANKNEKHNIDISVSTGAVTVRIDNVALSNLTFSVRPGLLGATNNFVVTALATGTAANTIRTGNNFNTFPNLNSVGFAVGSGGRAEFSNYKLIDVGQSARGTLLSDTAGATYSIFNGIPGITTAGNMITVENGAFGYANPSYGSEAMVRTKFATDAGKTIRNAKVYVTAMGIYEMYINGQRVGSDWFNPGMAQYRSTLNYHTYDVTDLLVNGDNAVGAIVAPGFWTGYMTFTPGNYNMWGDNEALLAKLVIAYTDGTAKTVVTNPTDWKLFTGGPVEYAGNFQGQRYNAKKEAAVEGWSAAAYIDTAWKTPDVITPKSELDFDLTARRDVPVRVQETLTPTRLLSTRSEDLRTYIYDMGVALVGVPSVTIPAGALKEGDTVILRYGEDIYPGNADSPNLATPAGVTYESLYGPNGTYRPGVAGRPLYDTYRAAMATDFYTASKADETRDVVIEPHFTYRGYRYVQITVPSRTEPLPLANVKGLVLSSSNITSSYSAATADGDTGELVTQLAENIQRSQYGNFFSIPTDCPQRNERMGWTGDCQAYSRTATYNGDVQSFFHQWMKALRDDQFKSETSVFSGDIGQAVPRYQTTLASVGFYGGTTWEAAVCQVPWQVYQQYGDLDIIKDNMQTMKDWLACVNRLHLSGTTTEGKPFQYLSGKTTGHADWLSVDSRIISSLCNNAIYIYCMEITANMAEIIGDNAYAASLRDLRDKTKKEWNEMYVDPKTGMTRKITFSNPSQTTPNPEASLTTTNGVIDGQTSYCTPLNFNVFADDMFITEGPNAGVSYKSFAEKRLAELAADPTKSGNNNQYNGGTATSPPYSITTGFSGTPNILPALSRAGFVEDAYKMLSCTDYASWLYPVTLGSTTMWERWNSYELAFQQGGESSMNSFNHFALGSVGSWLYEYSLGITNDGAGGYQDFVLQPLLGDNFTDVGGYFTANYGKIVSEWTATEGVLDTYHTEVPANTTATLYLPIPAGTPVQTIRYAEFLGYSTRNGVSVAKFKLASGGFDFAFESGGSGGGSGGARRLIVRQSADYANGIVSSIKPFPVVVTSLKMGRTLQLNPVCEPAYIAVPAGGFEYSSLNTAVATVDSNGLVTAKKAGMTAIVVKALDGSDVKGMVTITVVS